MDRGKQSLETICLLLAYKIKYPENFFVLRGNHECASINRIYGFYDECKRRYNIKLWKTFTDCFNCLPIAAIIDEKIFTMHGGLSPDLNSMEQIRRVMRPTDVSAPRLPHPRPSWFSVGDLSVPSCSSTRYHDGLSRFIRILLAWLLKLKAWPANENRFLTAVSCATFCGPIRTRTLRAGVKTTEVSHSRLVPMSSPVSSRSTIWI